MERILYYTITNQEEGKEILSFLREKGFSKNILSSMKTISDAILLNGEKAFGRTKLKEGDFLRIRIPETEASPHIVPSEIPLPVLYEDEDLLIVNKPANMPIHPSQGNYENTLANAAAWYFQQKGQTFVYRCINRLDRDTTGALILAKNALSAALLGNQMQKRQIRRTYLALSEGMTPDSGTICAPIAREKDSVITRIVDFESGEKAVTHFERLDFSNGLSLLELHLETGRTHQIRVHLKHLGFPIPGDYLYNPHYEKISRQALHSYQLNFSHPITGKILTFTAPVPDDFVMAFRGKGNGGV
ncbi:MAG: RluA family pseudouridine synthase [Eubacteriales bacterium]|nr:RluA family pseudouridine synthase [Eubacteriales bacterium]